MWQQHLIKSGRKFKLRSCPTDAPKSYKGNKEKAEVRLKELCEELGHYQELMYAQGTHKLLIVLQAMDTGGKDGTIRYVFSSTNPQSVDVTSFKKPTPEELAHDFLWRTHRFTPEKGKMMIFNRSHYEDVVTVKVHKLVPKGVIEQRYGHITDFERMLTDEGVTVLKFFLHISKDEQKKRLQERLDDPKKHWKFNIADIEERKNWDKYMDCYEEAIEHTSRSWAPWVVVPADKKWYRNLVVAECIVEHLKRLNMHYRKIDFDPKEVIIK